MRFAAMMSSAVMVKTFLIALGYWVGSKLDARWGTDPVVMAAGILVGGGLGLYYVVHVLQRFRW